MTGREYTEILAWTPVEQWRSHIDEVLTKLGLKYEDVSDSLRIDVAQDREHADVVRVWIEDACLPSGSV